MPSQRVLEAEEVDSQNRVLDGPRKSGEKREVTGLRGQSNQLARSLDAPDRENEDLLEVRVGCQSCGATLTVRLPGSQPVEEPVVVKCGSCTRLLEVRLSEPQNRPPKLSLPKGQGESMKVVRGSQGATSKDLKAPKRYKPPHDPKRFSVPVSQSRETPVTLKPRAPTRFKMPILAPPEPMLVPVVPYTFQQPFYTRRLGYPTPPEYGSTNQHNQQGSTTMFADQQSWNAINNARVSQAARTSQSEMPFSSRDLQRSKDIEAPEAFASQAIVVPTMKGRKGTIIDLPDKTTNSWSEEDRAKSARVSSPRPAVRKMDESNLGGVTSSIIPKVCEAALQSMKSTGRPPTSINDNPQSRNMAEPIQNANLPYSQTLTENDLSQASARWPYFGQQSATGSRGRFAAYPDYGRQEMYDDDQVWHQFRNNPFLPMGPRPGPNLPSLPWPQPNELMQGQAHEGMMQYHPQPTLFYTQPQPTQYGPVIKDTPMKPRESGAPQYLLPEPPPRQSNLNFQSQHQRQYQDSGSRRHTDWSPSHEQASQDPHRFLQKRPHEMQIMQTPVNQQNSQVWRPEAIKSTMGRDFVTPALPFREAPMEPRIPKRPRSARSSPGSHITNASNASRRSSDNSLLDKQGLAY